MYAIEKKEEAAALMLEKNKRKFAADHLHIIRKDWLRRLWQTFQSPTHVFIGGSSGNLKDNFGSSACKKNPHVRIVINCHCPGNRGRGFGLFKNPSGKRNGCGSRVCRQSQKSWDRYHMMMGQNPVYVISCTGGKPVMRQPRFLLSAGASGSGKTMITCGILAALRKRGQKSFLL